MNELESDKRLTTIFKQATCFYKFILNHKNNNNSILTYESIARAKIKNNFCQSLVNESKKQGIPVPRPLNKIFKECTMYLNELTTQFEHSNQFIQNQPLLQFNSPSYDDYYIDYIQSKEVFFAQNLDALKNNKQLIDIKDIEQKMLEQFKKDNCLGCLASFTEEEPIPETSQLFSLVKANSINSLLEDDIKKKACALLNCGGGYLLLGQGVNKLKVKALKLSQQQRNKLHSFVYKTLKQRLFPNNFQLQIDSVRTQTLNNKKSKDAQGQKSLIIRVALSPNTESSLYFVQKKVLKYPALYSCYFLNTEAVGSVNDVCILQNAEDIYKIITKHRSMVRFQCRKNFFHHKHNCVKTYKFIGSLKLQILDEIINLDQYRQKAVLVILKAINAQEFILSIKKQLINNKLKQCYLHKAPSFWTDCTMKQTWLLDHQYNIKVLSKIIQSIIQKEKDKSRYVLITCTKYLFINKRQPQCLKEYVNTFNSCFGKKPKIKKVQNDLYIVLDKYIESFFSFTYLDNLEIKVRFQNLNKLRQKGII